MKKNVIINIFFFYTKLQLRHFFMHYNSSFQDVINSLLLHTYDMFATSCMRPTYFLKIWPCFSSSEDTSISDSSFCKRMHSQYARKSKLNFLSKNIENRAERLPLMIIAILRVKRKFAFIQNRHYFPRYA